MMTVACPDCGGETRLLDTRFGRVFWCQSAACGGRVSATKDGRVYGTPASAAGRAARIDAHAALDRLWAPQRRGSRGRVYAWLRTAMDLTQETCHLRYFNEAQCHTVIDLATKRLTTHGPFQEALPASQMAGGDWATRLLPPGVTK